MLKLSSRTEIESLEDRIVELQAERNALSAENDMVNRQAVWLESKQLRLERQAAIDKANIENVSTKHWVQ